MLSKKSWETQVHKVIQHTQLAVYLHVFNKLFRINDIINGKNVNFFIKVKHLATKDVEKIFSKVKEVLEVSQHVFNDRNQVLTHQLITGEEGY